MTTYLVVFGAAVRPDGAPSGTLARRCELAANVGSRISDATWLVTGGQGRFGPPEGVVMRDMLVGMAIASERIVVEAKARDTLESIRLCSGIMRDRGDADRVIVCSSGYHSPRCVLLLRVLGFRTTAARAASDRRYLGLAKWLKYVLKELIATPWDVAILIGLRAVRRV